MGRAMNGWQCLLKIILFVAAAGCLFLPAAGSASVLSFGENALPDDPGRFNGIWWGQALSELKGMRYVSPDPTNSGELFYFRPGDVLQMGDVKLEYVQYGFWKGLYSSLAFGVKGEENWEALKRICFGNYNGWHRPDWRVEKFQWVGKHSAMTLQYDEVLSEGQLYVYSKTIYERQLVEARRKGAGPQSHKSFWAK